MLVIFRKEIHGFFSSLTGYIVIIIFLLINSLFMWVFPGEWNIFDRGYAGLDTLFFISPWVFLFLVPSVTMRMIAEEKRLGTIELIYSKPISERGLVYGKFLASVVLVIFALLPAIIYYISIYTLGETPGNLDKGGTMGAFIGLFFLASVYASAGIFSSSLTDNQVIAFMIAVVICFLLYMGFDSFAYLPGLKELDEFVIRLGINEHYKSVSRGVIDIRDIAYFLALIAIFCELTIFSLQSGRSNQQSNLRAKAWMSLGITIVSIVVLAMASGLLRTRIDLTEDKRYTLSEPTREVLSGLENDIYIQVYLDGEMPIPLKRLQRSVNDLLEEFRVASGRKVDFAFINPSKGGNEEQRNARYESLIRKGLSPTRLRAGDQEGGSSQRIIFPGMIVNYNGIEVPVNFLKNNPTLSSEQNILHSSEGLEYEVIQTIATLSSDTVYRVAFIEGHAEIPEIETADITFSLAKYFTIDRGTIGGKTGSLDGYSAVVLAGPRTELSEADKFVLDQYIMQGGRVLWLLDEVYVNTDSLSKGETAALYMPLNIEDQLFRYGARVNPEIVQDVNCQLISMKVIGSGGNQQFVQVPWIYYPLLIPSAKHPVTRNINRVKGEFVNYIDTVGLDGAIKKQVLLSTSEFARTVKPPVLISLDEAERLPDQSQFSRSNLPVAVLLEGVFPSAFRNRMINSFLPGYTGQVMTESENTKMIVVADADIIRNGVRRTAKEETPLPLGQDRYSGEIYGNTDFLVNSINYLVDDKGLLDLRSRELKIRLLNASKVKAERLKWQMINILGPVVLVVVAGMVYSYLRKKRYAGR